MDHNDSSGLLDHANWIQKTIDLALSPALYILSVYLVHLHESFWFLKILICSSSVIHHLNIRHRMRRSQTRSFRVIDCLWRIQMNRPKKKPAIKMRGILKILKNLDNSSSMIIIHQSDYRCIVCWAVRLAFKKKERYFMTPLQQTCVRCLTTCNLWNNTIKQYLILFNTILIVIR